MLDPLRQRFRALQAERDLLEANRYTTIAVQWQLPDGSTLLHAGGTWDAIDKRYLPKEPDQVRIIRLRESQVEAARWLAWWLQERAEGRKRDFRSLFLLGDRGGGKTFLATVGTVTALVKFPRMDGKPTLAWQVVSSYRERREIEREIESAFPFENTWYTRRLAPEHEYRFVHGPLLVTLSGDNPESLRQGTVDYLFLNECTKLQEDAYISGIARLKDHDGLCIATTNPPKTNRGRWVKKFWDTAQERKEGGKPFSLRFVRVDSAGNDLTHQDAADDVADQIRVLNPRAAQADIDGLMLPIDQPAYWEWVPSRNARPLPDLGDITRQYLKRRTGREYDYLIGADFQGRPFQVAVVAKIYGSLDEPLVYFCDEVICPQATEGDLADAVLEAGYTPDNAYWVADNSGQWQNSQRNSRWKRNEFTSHSQIASRGFHIVPCIKPKEPGHQPANPLVEQRINLINAQLKASRIFVDPEGAPRLAESLKECILRATGRGRVIPTGVHAHASDALGYPAWWIYSKGRRTLPTGPLAIVGERNAPSLFG